PCSYPPIPVNGFLICGMLWPGGSQPYTHPNELAAEIEQTVPGYIVDVNLHGKEKEEIAKELFRSIELRKEASRRLMKRYDWDLFWTVFTESNRAQHRFWAAFDESHPKHSEQPPSLRTAILEIYERLDEAVGAIVAELDEETSVFIVSDHGFGPFYAAFDIPG